MKKPKLIFLTLYRHHLRYFSHLIGEEQPYAGEVRHVAACLRPRFGEKATPLEIEAILRYPSKRSANRAENFLSRGLLPIVGITQRMLATLYFANFYSIFHNEGIKGIVIWNGQNLPLAAAAAAARRLGLSVIYMENGPLPQTTMVDPAGINFENVMPRTADFYTKIPIEQAALDRLLQTPLVPRTPKRKDAPTLQTSLPAKYYFLPFQTYSDTQILLFSPWIPDMDALVRTVHRVLKDSTIEPVVLVAKAHPSCRKNYDGLREEMALQGVVFAEGVSTAELIQRSCGVITINSSVGIEAMLMDRPVLTLGQAFYNIPGLVLHADNSDELKKGLEQLHIYRPESGVREGFLYYLRYCYLVEGTHRNPDSNHVQAVGQRIYELISMNKS